MKSFFYLISLLLLASLSHRGGRAQVPSQQEGEGSVQEPAVAADVQGHVYVAGTFTGSLTFGGTTLTADTGSGFLVQFDGAGGVEWATSLEGVYLGTTLGLAVGATGSLYLSGAISSVDSVRLVPEAPLHAGSFVARFTPEGDLEWIRAVQGLEGFSIVDFSAGQDGYLYVTGGLCGFECSRLIAAKLDGQGNTVWATRGEGDAVGLGIAVDTGGNAHLTGSMAFGPATFGEITLGTEGKPNDSDMFAGVLDAEGGVVWGYRAGGGPRGRGIAVDPQGHSYVVGIYSDTLAFGEAVLFPDEEQRGGGFLVKLDAGGHVLWARRIPEMGGDTGQTVVVAESGNVYVAGNAVSTSQGAERSGVMLAAYDASGSLVSSELLENVQVGYYHRARELSQPVWLRHNDYLRSAGTRAGQAVGI